MILVINSGSSSIKFKLFNEKDIKQPIEVLDGIAERIAIDGVLVIKYNNQKYNYQVVMKNHQDAIRFILEKLIDLNLINDPKDIKGIGFRVVHGGTISKSSNINDDVYQKIKDAIKIAPLHNPGAIMAIDAVKKLLPDAKLIACFDTAFHQTLEESQYLYAVPYSWYKKYGVRKYGFHGISYQYITEKMSQILNKSKDKLNIIVCHLGNGASIACIKNGKSYDTTMGFTPLAGLMMGTRSGDVDPSILEYMCKELKLNINDVTNILNKESGLKGLSEKSSDMRDVMNEYFKNDISSVRAINKYTQIIADFIIKYANLLNGMIDGIVFTAGIGENSAHTREFVIGKLPLLNVELDNLKNNTKYDEYNEINSKNSKIKIFAIRTNEELMICKDVIKLV